MMRKKEWRQISSKRNLKIKALIRIKNINCDEQGPKIGLDFGTEPQNLAKLMYSSLFDGVERV